MIAAQWIKGSVFLSSGCLLLLWIVTLLLCVLLVSCLSPPQLSWQRGQPMTSARAARALSRKTKRISWPPFPFLEWRPLANEDKEKSNPRGEDGNGRGQREKRETQASHNSKLSIYLTHGVRILVRISELGVYQLNQRNRWPIHHHTSRKWQSWVSFSLLNHTVSCLGTNWFKGAHFNSSIWDNRCGTASTWNQASFIMGRSRF